MLQLLHTLKYLALSKVGVQVPLTFAEAFGPAVMQGPLKSISYPLDALKLKSIKELITSLFSYQLRSKAQPDFPLQVHFALSEATAKLGAEILCSWIPL